MPDPISLTLAGVALTKGVEFLYGQASEILKRWRERKDKAKEKAEEAAGKGEREAVEVKLPEEAFEGQLSDPKIHFDQVKRFEDELKALRAALAVYANGDEEADESDTVLAERLDALRLVLEQIYQQRLTFKGERRAPSGVYIDSEVEVEEVEGRVRGIVAEIKEGMRLRSRIKTGDVRATGDVIGVDASPRREEEGE